MSPGAIWTPFEITKEEYAELVNAVTTTPPDELSKNARYCKIQFEFDAEFDDIGDWLAWLNAVCQKHRENYHRRKGLT